LPREINPVGLYIQGLEGAIKESTSASGASHFVMYIASSKDPMIAELKAPMVQSIPSSTGFAHSC
jgi:hypothetical protein